MTNGNSLQRVPLSPDTRRMFDAMEARGVLDRVFDSDDPEPSLQEKQNIERRRLEVRAEGFAKRKAR